MKALPARGATVPSGGEPLVEIGNPGGLWVVADVANLFGLRSVSRSDLKPFAIGARLQTAEKRSRTTGS